MKHSHRQIPVAGEIGQHVEVVQTARPAHVGELVDQAREAAHLRQRDGEIGGGDDGGHFDEELDHVDDQHSPQAGMGGEHDVQQADREQRLPAAETEQHGGDLAGGEIHRGHDDAVEEQAEVEGAEAAHGAGGLAGVAELVEFQVGEHAGTAPQPRVKEDRGHAGEGEGPPLPIAGNSLGAHEVGHQVGGVAREGGGHHGKACQPPRNRAAGGKEFGRAPAGALADKQRGRETDGDRGKRNDPVNRMKLHGYLNESTTIRGSRRAGTQFRQLYFSRCGMLA